jgi:hypothetical protein
MNYAKTNFRIRFFYSDIKVSPNYNWIKRYTLKKFHPSAIFIDAAAIIWVGYYLWFQMWQHALIVYLLGRFIGTLSVLNIDPDRMAQSMSYISRIVKFKPM